nr:glutamate--tRNA ligase [Alphaproteobacteria bacterium]
MIRVRFAPSPTGKLHAGNARIALMNYLFARKHGGEFMLRMDDTDSERSRPEYAEAIKRDLAWLGIETDIYEAQSNRYPRYTEMQEKLIANGRLYACYETAEELELKRKILLGQNKPPLYDR